MPTIAVGLLEEVEAEMGAPADVQIPVDLVDEVEAERPNIVDVSLGVN